MSDFNAEAAKAITESKRKEKLLVSLKPILASIEAAARAGYNYLDLRSLSLNDEAELKRRGFKVRDGGCDAYHRGEPQYTVSW